MTRAIPRLVLVASLAVPLGAASCGGGSDSAQPSADASATTIEADFLTRADDVCAPYAAYNAKHLLAVAGFSRLAPDAAQLPRIAAFLDRNPAYHSLVSKLQELGEPAGGADDWDAVVADLAEGQRLVQQEVRAARARDVDAFVAAEGERATSNAGLHAALLAAGVAGDSPCLSAQGDPLQTTSDMH